LDIVENGLIYNGADKSTTFFLRRCAIDCSLYIEPYTFQVSTFVTLWDIDWQ